MRVILSPEKTTSKLAPLLIEGSLFLVGRHEPPLSGYSSADCREVTSVNYRHARVVEDGGLVFVVDLGSTTGTTINGLRLKAHCPVRIYLHDIVCFGYLCLRVKIQEPKSVSHEKRSAPPAPDQLFVQPQPFYDGSDFVVWGNSVHSGESWLELDAITPEAVAWAMNSLSGWVEGRRYHLSKGDLSRIRSSGLTVQFREGVIG